MKNIILILKRNNNLLKHKSFIKFQINFAEEFLSKDHPRYDHFKKQSFSEKQWIYVIKNLKKKINKKIYADILGVRAFKLSKKLKFDGVKIHSSDLSNLKLLKSIGNEI